MSVSTWNVIITRIFFRGIPPSLHEAATIDGISKDTLQPLQIFLMKVVV